MDSFKHRGDYLSHRRSLDYHALDSMPYMNTPVSMPDMNTLASMPDMEPPRGYHPAGSEFYIDWQHQRMLFDIQKIAKRRAVVLANMEAYRAELNELQIPDMEPPHGFHTTGTPMLFNMQQIARRRAVVLENMEACDTELMELHKKAKAFYQNYVRKLQIRR